MMGLKHKGKVTLCCGQSFYLSYRFSSETFTLSWVHKKRTVRLPSINLNKKHNPRFHRNILKCEMGMTAQAGNPSAEEAETGNLKALDQLALHGKIMSQNKANYNNKILT